MGNDRVVKPLRQNPEGVGVNRHGVKKYQEVETGGEGVAEIEMEQKGLG